MLLGAFKKSPDQHAAIERVRDWTRERFKLAEDETVMVTELTCTLPGCAPIETLIAFWTEKGRHHFKVFKPVTEVSEDDLPPSWMKNALLEMEGITCSCCG